MNRRDQLRGIAAGVLCIGVLMGGVGTGIALADFSGFSYRVISVSEEKLKTEIFTYEILPEDEEEIWVNRRLGDQACVIREQEDVPENLVEVKVVYNSELCRPYMQPHKDDEADTHLFLYMDFYESDIERMMKYKDQFLEGLREQEFREFQERYVELVEYRVNPVNRDKVCIN